MTAYCWGDRNIPYPIRDQTDDQTIIEIDGKPKQIPSDRIKGWVKSGQKVRVLVLGGNWLPGIVLDGDCLRVHFDKGFARQIYDASWMQVVPVVPFPELEDFEADEMAMAQQYDLLEPLVVGDRVRVVLAGSPLEFLAGLLGAVEGAETFGLIPVNVDGHGSKVLRREQLDKVEPNPLTVMDEQKVHDSNPLDLPKTSETLENSYPDPSIDDKILVGSKVRHDVYWKTRTGVVQEIQGILAMVLFREGIPVYPCAIAHLRVVE